MIASLIPLTVVEPWSGQLYGDAFPLVAPPPHHATIDRYLALGRIPESG